MEFSTDRSAEDSLMMRRPGIRPNPIVFGLVVGVVLGALFLGGGGAQYVVAVDQDSYDELETFTNVLTIVQKNYVEEVGTQELVEGAVKAAEEKNHIGYQIIHESLEGRDHPTCIVGEPRGELSGVPESCDVTPAPRI